MQELIQAAIEVRKNSYSPYSNFAVGSAVRTKSNEIITGCNVENGAYGPSICAERNAFCHAISLGQREFVAVAVVAYQENSFTTPCGMCRQFMAEFAQNDFPIYVAKPSPNRVLVSSIFELLPYGFIPMKSDNLNRNT